VISAIRRRMIELGFRNSADFDLVVAEGARDFLVPSRLYPANSTRCRRRRNSSAALMVIASTAFPDRTLLPRRGRPRRRTPGRIYQLDVEMSFVTQEDVSPRWNSSSSAFLGSSNRSGNERDAGSTFQRVTYKDRSALRHGQAGLADSV